MDSRVCLSLTAILAFGACSTRTDPCDALRCPENSTCAEFLGEVPYCRCGPGYQNTGRSTCAPERWQRTEGDRDIGFWDVLAIARDSVWATGNGRGLYRFDGISWARVEYPGDPDPPYRAMWGFMSDDVWISAHPATCGGDPTRSGLLLHWDGTALAETTISPATPLFSSIHGSAADNVWAMGAGCAGYPGSCVFHRWDGTRWTLMAGDRYECGAVWVGGENDLWASGDSGSVHWDGRRWNPFDEPQGGRFTGAVGGDLWVRDPYVQRLGDQGWEAFEGCGGSMTATDFWSGGPDDLWLLKTGFLASLLGSPDSGLSHRGCVSEVIHWNGQTCANELWEIDDYYCLTGISGVPGSNVWVVGPYRAYRLAIQ